MYYYEIGGYILSIYLSIEWVEDFLRDHYPSLLGQPIRELTAEEVEQVTK